MKFGKLAGILAARLATVLLLSSCGGSQKSDSGTSAPQEPEGEKQEVTAPALPPDLSGEWKSEEKEEAFQGANITDDTIEIYWVGQDDGEDFVALYWAGTFVPPSDGKEPYSWESVNDTEKTSSALLASEDETKVFTYQDGKISYSVTFAGETRTLDLQKGEWGYGTRANSNMLLDTLFSGGSATGGGETMEGSGDLGDYHVEIKGASLAKDWSGNNAIVIEYTWTNNSDDTTSAMMSMYEKAFQDGVELDTALVDGVSDNYTKDVRPGVSIDVKKAFELTSDTSEVELEISEAFSWTDDIVTARFNPAELD